MTRSARVVLPDVPHHVTHRGNRRQRVFFGDRDREVYLEWLAFYADACGLEVWAYCLMQNHVHLLAVGRRSDAFATAVGRTHGRYAQWINRRHKWSGHLWANRFYSAPLDESHLWAAVKYIELNPVRAGMVLEAIDYPWSSARAHTGSSKSPILAPTRPFPGDIMDWSRWLAEGVDSEVIDRIRQSTSTGRPAGSDRFIREIEKKLDRRLMRQRPGRKPARESRLSGKAG